MSLLQVALTALLDRKLAQPHALALPAPAEPNLTKGLLAGLIAGLAGAAAQSLVE
jgi:putative membrane protein